MKAWVGELLPNSLYCLFVYHIRNSTALMRMSKNCFPIKSRTFVTLFAVKCKVSYCAYIYIQPLYTKIKTVHTTICSVAGVLGGNV